MKVVSGIVLMVAVLTLVVAPATCSGGLLVHCCAPEESDHGDDHHEHACPVDPCNRDTVIAAARSTDEDVHDADSAPAVLPEVTVPAAHGSTTTWWDVAPTCASPVAAPRSLPLLC